MSPPTVDLARHQLAIAAALGHPPSREALGLAALETEPTLREQLTALEPWGRMPLSRVASTAARAALPIWQASHPTISEPEGALQATESWQACPCEEHAALAKKAAFKHGDPDSLKWAGIALPSGAPVTPTQEAAHWSCDLAAYTVNVTLADVLAVARGAVQYAIEATGDDARVHGEVVDAVLAWALSDEAESLPDEPQPSPGPVGTPEVLDGPRCPECGGRIEQYRAKDTLTGREMRPVRCLDCSWVGDVNTGPAMWKLLEEARKKE